MGIGLHQVQTPVMTLGETGCNLARLLWDKAESHGSSAAVLEGKASIDYETLVGRAGAIGALLSSNGVGENDRVAILLQNGVDAAASFFAVLAVGAIAVNVNEALRPRQIEYVLDHSGSTTVITSSQFLPAFTGRSLTTITVDETEQMAGAVRLGPVNRLPSDVAQIIYTSGSSGQPKGVTLSHANLWASIHAIQAYLGIQSDDRIAAVLPFAFTYGLNQLLCAVNVGAALLIENSTLAATVVENLRASGATVLAGVPTLWLQLLEVPAFQQEPVESLRILTSAGGHLPIAVVRTLRESQPQAKLFLMYGMTEVIRSTFLDPSQVTRRPGSIGKAIPGAEIMVLRDDLSPCKPGEIGELVHRGPTVALGYWNDPEATTRTFRPNPFGPAGRPVFERVVFSGDLVWRDVDGYLYFVSRCDRLIKSLGYRVGPDEILDTIHSSGQVSDAAVVAEPDLKYGSRIVAYVVLQKRTGSIEALQQFCRSELPRFMQPARFEVRDRLPRLANGKHDLAALETPQLSLWY